MLGRDVQAEVLNIPLMHVKTGALEQPFRAHISRVKNAVLLERFISSYCNISQFFDAEGSNIVSEDLYNKRR